jgi:putative addiction module component (TIGR02574 family)
MRMSSAAFDNLRSSVLSLSETERAQLACELVQSLDGTADADATEAWDKEIDRRVADIESGRAALIDRAEFNRRIRERLDR